MSKADHHFASLDTPPQYVSVGSNDIAYRVIGSGPPLVLIAGWPLNSQTYKHVLPYLTTYFQCVLLDSPGLGDTQWHSKTDFTFSGQAKTVSDFLDKLGIERYYLMAHDTGATISRLMAAEHKERVRGLVLLNTEIPHEKPPWFPFYARLMRIPGARFSLASF